MAATLSTTIIEEITLNGDKTRLVNSKSITGVNNLFRRVIALPASLNTTIAVFQASENTENVALDLEDTRYIRITNLSTHYAVTLSLQVAGAEGGTANMSTSILLDAGKSFMLGTVHDGIAVRDADAMLVSDLNDLESIVAICGGTSVDLEVFVATL